MYKYIGKIDKIAADFNDISKIILFFKFEDNDIISKDGKYYAKCINNSNEIELIPIKKFDNINYLLIKLETNSFNFIDRNVLLRNNIEVIFIESNEEFIATDFVISSSYNYLNKKYIEYIDNNTNNTGYDYIHEYIGDSNDNIKEDILYIDTSNKEHNKKDKVKKDIPIRYSRIRYNG